MGEKMAKFYVTTAIDYVNAAPHIGHAYEKIAADILARYHRLKGDDVYFQTGVDEHGSNVEKAALRAEIPAKVFCDQMTEKFKHAWDKLGLSYDHFFRTTDQSHYQAVQGLFRKMLAKGDIYKGTYKGLYCEGCEDFKRDRDLDEDGNCPNHKKPPYMCSEENYFFRLSKYKEAIGKWLTENPDVVHPDGRRKEVINQLFDPELTDFSVSRSKENVSWGIPVPDDPDHVIYVWLDALANYITGIGYSTDEKQFSNYWPADVHLIGKDITKFHAIYWPAFLMSAEVALPKKISVHGFITVEGKKISKTIGNVIDPNELVDQYGADAIRYFLFAATSFTQDGDFSKVDFINRVNADLANNLGNLLNRTLTLVEKNCQARVPKQEMNNVLREEANEVYVIAGKHIDGMEFAKAIEAIFALVDQLNKYINDEKPWALFKEGKTSEGNVVLYTALDGLRRTAIMLYPFCPQLACAIWEQLGYETELDSKNGKAINIADLIPEGQAIRNKGPIFKRIEEVAVES